MQPGVSLTAMRAARPLVQCITNFVAMNISANVLLAAGASPAMVSDAGEAAEFAALSDALSVNIGTLSAPFVAGMRAAIAGATGAGRPWVLDPVACQATGLRRRVAAELVALRPTIIRANASEILSLAGQDSRGQGVDGRDGTAAGEGAALRLARSTGAVVAMTGAVDFVTDGARAVRIAGGSDWMPLNTALGCSLSALCGAFAAAVAPFEASVAALSLFAVAGAQADGVAQGPGSFAPLFLDALHGLDPQALQGAARIEMLEPA